MVKRHKQLFLVLVSSISFSLVAMEEKDHKAKVVRQRHEKNPKNTEQVCQLLAGEVRNDTINRQQANAIERDDFYGQQRSFHCADHCCLFGVAFVLGGALLIQKVYQHYMVEYPNDKTL